MRKLALILFTILTAVLALAQAKANPQCPTDYDFVGAVCQNSSTGDIVLPN